MIDEEFMKLALIEAYKAYKEDEVPVGAIIVKDNIIIASAHNLRETLKDPTAHAEILAIRKAAQFLGGWRLLNCEIYVTIEPCPMCAGAIINSRIKRLIYGANDPKAGACGSIMDIMGNTFLNHKVEIANRILEYECGKILKEYFRQKRK